MQLFDAASLSDRALEQILSFLRGGGVIAFPTDTAYGLGADPFNEGAVRRIFEMKGRAETKPILVLVDSIAMANSIAKLSDTALTLAERFWPGPLTMILPARASVSATVTAGTETIGVRWANTVFTQRLLGGLWSADYSDKCQSQRLAFGRYGRGSKSAAWGLSRDAGRWRRTSRARRLHFAGRDTNTGTAAPGRPDR